MNTEAVLAPSASILLDYKAGRIDTYEYTYRYKEEVLAYLDPAETFDALGHDAVLCCFEKKGDFCHRHIVANWF